MSKKSNLKLISSQPQAHVDLTNLDSILGRLSDNLDTKLKAGKKLTKDEEECFKLLMRLMYHWTKAFGH